MADNQEPTSNNNSQDSHSDSAGEKGNEIIDNKKDAQPTTQGTTYIQCQPPIVNFNIPKQEKNTPKIYWISFFGNIINLGLLVGTYFIWQAAKDANRISARSLEALQNSINSNDSLAKVNYQLNKTAFESSNKASEKSIAAQVSSLQKTEQRFNTENEPILQIQKPTVDTVGIGKIVKMIFTIENLGIYPTKVLDCKMNIFADTVTPKFSALNDTAYSPIEIVNRYIVKGYPLGYTIMSGDTTNYEDMIYINSGKYFIYLIGIIRYTNIITENPKIYKFKIKAKIKTGIVGAFIYSENFVVHNAKK